MAYGRLQNVPFSILEQYLKLEETHISVTLDLDDFESFPCMFNLPGHISDITTFSYPRLKAWWRKVVYSYVFVYIPFSVIRTTVTLERRVCPHYMKEFSKLVIKWIFLSIYLEQGILKKCLSTDFSGRVSQRHSSVIPLHTEYCFVDILLFIYILIFTHRFILHRCFFSS